MKTMDEMIEAMDIMTKEASDSGFTFCAGITKGTPDKVTVMYCGEQVKLLGVTEVIKAAVFDEYRPKKGNTSK